MDIATVGGDQVVAVAREPREGGGVDLFIAGSKARVEEALAGLESTCVEAGGGLGAACHGEQSGGDHEGAESS